MVAAAAWGVEIAYAIQQFSLVPSSGLVFYIVYVIFPYYSGFFQLISSVLDWFEALWHKTVEV